MVQEDYLPNFKPYCWLCLYHVSVKRTENVDKAEWNAGREPVCPRTSDSIDSRPLAGSIQSFLWCFLWWSTACDTLYKEAMRSSALYKAEKIKNADCSYASHTRWHGSWRQKNDPVKPRLHQAYPLVQIYFRNLCCVYIISKMNDNICDMNHFLEEQHAFCLKAWRAK